MALKKKQWAIDLSEGIEGLLQVDPNRALQLFYRLLRKNELQIFDYFKALIENHKQNAEFMSVR